MLDFSLLTPRQREIYDFIREKIEGRGYGPTVREIGKAFHIASPNGVMCHLKALQTKGFIKREGFSARAIELVDFKLGGSRGLPLLGAVAAGKPIEAVENPELLNVNKMFEGDDHFALQVRGDSMIEDHIEDGDYVVLRKKKHPSKGECVVARINGDVTLKLKIENMSEGSSVTISGVTEPIIIQKNSEQTIRLREGEVSILGGILEQNDVQSWSGIPGQWRTRVAAIWRIVSIWSSIALGILCMAPRKPSIQFACFERI